MKISLLTIEELRQYHTQKTTDFAYLLGAWQTEKATGKVVPFYNSEEDGCDSPRFSSTVNGYGWVSSFYPNGEDWAFQSESDMSCPLVLEKRSVADNMNMVLLNKKGHLLDENEINSTFIFGAYPQTVAGEEAEKLEGCFCTGTLVKTRNAYTYFVNDSGIDPFSQKQQKCFEYEMDGKRYVRIVPQKMHFLHNTFILSDGQKIEPEKPYWVKVEPLRGTMFGKKFRSKDNFVCGKIYSDVAPVAGITWNRITPFLEKYFMKEIMQSHDFCLEKMKDTTILKRNKQKLNAVKMRD